MAHCLGRNQTPKKANLTMRASFAVNFATGEITSVLWDRENQVKEGMTAVLCRDVELEPYGTIPKGSQFKVCKVWNETGVVFLECCKSGETLALMPFEADASLLGALRFEGQTKRIMVDALWSVGTGIAWAAGASIPAYLCSEVLPNWAYSSSFVMICGALWVSMRHGLVAALAYVACMLIGHEALEPFWQDYAHTKKQMHHEFRVFQYMLMVTVLPFAYKLSTKLSSSLQKSKVTHDSDADTCRADLRIH